jgi:hypothetical protein
MAILSLKQPFMTRFVTFSFHSWWHQELPLPHIVQTGFAAQPVTYPIGIGDSFLGVKLPGREADLSLPTSAELKETWICTAAPHVFMAKCLVKHRDFISVGFEVFTAMTQKNAVFWDVTP